MCPARAGTGNAILRRSSAPVAPSLFAVMRDRSSVPVKSLIESAPPYVLAMNDQPETFPIRLGDLPSDLNEGVRAELRHFAVPLILNDDFLGSGVLVEVDNIPGILTAEHVVNNPAAPFDNSLESK